MRSGCSGSLCAMADQAESSRRAAPMTPPPPPPPSPAIPEDDSSDAIPNLWGANDECSSSTPHTNLLSLWLSNYTALPPPEAEEDVDVPALLNFDLESSFPDLVDYNTTSAVVTQALDVTPPLWVQLHNPAAGEVDDLSRLALRIQSPQASILPLALGIQPPEASVSPLALGKKSSPVSFGIQAPEAPISPLALSLQPPQASFGIQSPQACIAPLALGIQSFIFPLASDIQSPQASVSPLALGIQSTPDSFSSLPAIPSALPMAPPLWNLPEIPCTLPMALPLWNLPAISSTLPMAPPLWNLPAISCTLPVAPPLWNLLPSPSPVPERRSWSVFPSPPPSPARRQQLLLPHSASATGSSPSSTHPSQQPHHFFPAANTVYQQQVPGAHSPVTFSTPNANANANANANSFAFDPATRSQAMAPRRSWTTNQPWIHSNVQDMKLPIPRRPRFFLPAAAAAAMPAPRPLLANFGSSEGNKPNWNAGGDIDVPAGDHQRVQTGESSGPSRKRSKLVLDPSVGEMSQWSQDGAEVAPIAREEFAPGPALNRNGMMRALPGTAIDSQSMFARYRREKIRQRIKILQRLIPNGDKVEMTIFLEQAHVYIKFLEQQIKLLKSGVDWKLVAASVYNDIDLSH